MLALRSRGLVGKPVYNNTHGFFFDTTSRDPERWIGQLSDGSWVVGLFNRDDGPKPTTKSIDFVSELGLQGQAAVRDVWAHEDLGEMTSFSASLSPHACRLITVTPKKTANYETEVGAWTGTAQIREHVPRPRGARVHDRARYPREQRDTRHCRTVRGFLPAGVPCGERDRLGVLARRHLA